MSFGLVDVLWWFQWLAGAYRLGKGRYIYRVINLGGKGVRGGVSLSQGFLVSWHLSSMCEIESIWFLSESGDESL